jgi:predicted kinase
MKKLIIVRGLPGSGKSMFVDDFLYSPLCTVHGVVCSADNYFMHDGEYQFDPNSLGDAHNYCKGVAIDAMIARASLVVIDNTNSQKWEFMPYLTLARDYNYDVTQITVGQVNQDVVAQYHQRNKHGVPEETIRKMVERWEF